MNTKSRDLDQFYTTPIVAQWCIDILLSSYSSLTLNNEAFFIEPSAGKGAFLAAIPSANKVGFDIDPKDVAIVKQDFLTLDLSQYTNRGKLVFIGNPPFGKNASLAVKFFNHCAKHADIIAFIVPKSFLKPSISNRLNKYFKLISSTPTPPVFYA